MSPKVFKDPLSFIPERWTGDERFANDERSALQPFSVGPRDCLGKKYVSIVTPSSISRTMLTPYQYGIPRDASTPRKGHVQLRSRTVSRKRGLDGPRSVYAMAKEAFDGEAQSCQLYMKVHRWSSATEMFRLRKVIYILLYKSSSNGTQSLVLAMLGRVATYKFCRSVIDRKLPA